MLSRSAAVIGLALAAGCAPVDSNWHLMASGYSIDPRDGGDFAMEVHYNQLKQLGGDVKSAEFRLFIGERLKRNGICPAGWELPPCVKDGSCVEKTSRSVTVAGRCLQP